MTAIKRRLFEPVGAASVAAYRVLFGVLMLVATLRFFAYGWIAVYYEMPSHFFSYDGFEWVKPWPGPGMYIHFGAMAVLAVMIAIGAWYRFSVAAFGALFGYAHLIDKTNYLNHYFLVIWLCLLMTLLPLHGMWSVDARRRPSLRAYNPTVGVTYEFSPKIIAGLEYWARGRFDVASDTTDMTGATEAPARTHHYLGPTFLAQKGKVFFSLGAYLRLDGLADSAAVGDPFGKIWVRSLIGVEL